LFHVPRFRPWKRTYDVADVTAGTVGTRFFAVSDFGASTVT